MFTPKPIGVVKGPYSQTKDIPKGPGAKHDAVATLEISPDYEAGLIEIEGFSHLCLPETQSRHSAARRRDS